jgi:acyl transferase domain-containing protein
MPILNESSLSGTVAIIGMAGRFPGANDIDAFWDNLARGVDSLSRFEDSELEPSRLEPPKVRTLPNYVKTRGIVADADKFDAGFFNIIPREAAVMDPQHRLFLETAWAALESAGYDPGSYAKSVGVWAGMDDSTYYHENVAPRADAIAQVGFLQTTMANWRDYLTTRASYKLNLRGPSVNVYATGATSLVAVCEAFSALVSNQCDIALAGGVSVMVPQRVGYTAQVDEALSPDGSCRPFDAQAVGSVPGNGVGIVVLKRFEEAVADGDFIYSVIRGVGLNNEGAGDITPGSGAGRKAEVIAMAHAVASVEAATLSYVEGDGTAVPSADAAEIRALTQVFTSADCTPKSCFLGSVKSNIGHLGSAAGVVGLIKTALALHHRQLPPSLHFEHPAPALASEQSPFIVNTELRPWPKGTTPRRAGVSSFGSDGTNVHVVLQEAPRDAHPVSARREHLIVVSARNEVSLELATSRLAIFLQAHRDLRLADVAHTLQSGRRAFGFRRAVVCSSASDAAEALLAKEPMRVASGHRDMHDAKVAFMFPGQGAQHVGMAVGIYRDEPEFAAELDACARTLQPRLGLDLRSLIYPAPEHREEAERRLAETSITQPTLFAVELALARLWISWGVEPAAMIGHSLGEYVAACLAGVLSREQAASIVAARGRLMQAQPRGTMMAVALSANDLQPWLTPDVVIAAFNAPAFNVVAGPEAAIRTLEKQLTTRDVRCRPLATSHAFHSPMMDGALDPFRRELESAQLRAPTRPWISCVTGDLITPQQATDPEYWVKQLRQPVHFSDGVRRLSQDPTVTFLEVGPGRGLATLVRQHTDRPPQQAVVTCLDVEPGNEMRSMLHALGSLWAAGYSPDWPAHRRRAHGRTVPLPTYPFARTRHWLGSSKSDTALPDGAEGRASTWPELAAAAEAAGNGDPVADVKRRLRSLLVEASGHPPDAIGSSQTFLELGFDSLLLNQVIASIRKTFGLGVSLRQLLDQLSTLESLARHIHSSPAAGQAGNTAPAQRPTLGAQNTTTPPVPGARLGRDSQGRPAWFVPDPNRPGKYLQVMSS